MATRTIAGVPTQTGHKIFTQFLNDLEEKIKDKNYDKNELCIEILHQIYFPSSGNYQDLVNDENVSLSFRLALANLDPRNITFESENYSELNVGKFYKVKPLLWLWKMFDKSAFGHNIHFGVLFRKLIAENTFGSCGKNIRIFQDVEVSFAYNIFAGDDVVIHRNVLLDDRGKISIGNKASVSDYANIYSHTHSINDQDSVTCHHTEICEGARITYHSTILSGVKVGFDGMLGAMALATKEIKPHHVNVGIPAKSVRTKDRISNAYNSRAFSKV